MFVEIYSNDDQAITEENEEYSTQYMDPIISVTLFWNFFWILQSQDLDLHSGKKKMRKSLLTSKILHWLQVQREEVDAKLINFNVY